MKKKIIIASATVLFAVATVFNMNLLQGNSVGDVSLDAIAVMAQAQQENSTVNVNITENVKNKMLVVTTTTGTAQVQLCGEAAASYLGLVSGSITHCITVTIQVSKETHDCPSPGSTC